MRAYFDSSAIVKVYVEEPDSALVRQTMLAADAWFACRIGFVETARAIGLAAGELEVARFRRDWAFFNVIEVDQALAERAVALAAAESLQSLDALHLAAALLLPKQDLVFVSWDRRLHAAATSQGLVVVPEIPP